MLPPQTSTRQVRLFVSYAHEEAYWIKHLKAVLKVKAGVRDLQTWHDSEIRAGGEWDPEIRNELERMDIFLCLVSYKFLASDYIREVELKAAEERHARKEIEVLPVLLWQMDLKEECQFLSRFNPLPAWNEHWGQFPDAGAALYRIGNGIKKAINNVQERLLAQQD